MQNKKIATAILAILFLMVGCSSTANNTSYYLLTPPEARQSAEANGGPVILLAELKLANYLQQSGLALLQTDHQVSYATWHVWAEDLQQGIKRALKNDIENQSDITLEFSSRGAQPSCTLALQIDHFTPTGNAEVVLSGNYRLTGQQQRQTTKPFYLTAALDADGFNHSVEKQRALLTELASGLVAAAQAQCGADL